MHETMTSPAPLLPVHTLESAPSGSRPALERLVREVGFLPNLAATMAGAPPLIEAFTAVRSLAARGTFGGIERATIALTVSHEHECAYCRAAHSTFARAHRAPDETVEALRAGAAPADARLGALAAFTRAVLRARGALRPDDLRAFRDAGFTDAQALEAIVTVGYVTMANHAAHVAGTPLDAAFAPQAWAAAEARPAAA
jgi:uncharacterized peroxidase-related enzyme